jgi:hypothetical protein
MSYTEFDELTIGYKNKRGSIKFGEIILKITLHDGVRYIEKKVFQKKLK